jgi:transcription antitermination protein NusB
MATNTKHGARARARARRLTLQGLYQWQLSGTQADDIIAQLHVSQNTRDTDIEYFESLLRGAIADSDKLTTAFSRYLDRPQAQLDPVERAILLLSTHELAAHPDVPYRVVLNEAVELARKFGAEESYKYINAILDRIAAELRRSERAVV